MKLSEHILDLQDTLETYGDLTIILPKSEKDEKVGQEQMNSFIPKYGVPNSLGHFKRGKFEFDSGEGDGNFNAIFFYTDYEHRNNVAHTKTIEDY